MRAMTSTRSPLNYLPDSIRDWFAHVHDANKVDIAGGGEEE